MEKDKQITVIAALQTLLTAAWYTTNLFTQPQFLAASTFLILGYTVFYFVQYRELSDFRGKIQDNSGPSSLSMHEIRDVVKTWADTEYSGGVKVNWNFADYSTKPLHNWINGNDELYVITGAISGKEQSVQLFILASEGDVKEHKLVRHPDQYRRPFRYSDYYQEYRRKSKNQVLKESGGTGQPQNYTGYTAMAPVPQNPQPLPEDGDDSED